MEGTIYSLIPPVLAILMVILTRRVLLSLGVGILAAALLVANFNPVATVTLIWDTVLGLFYSVDDSELNLWNIYILAFLLILGIITAYISITGGSRAFADWAQTKIKTRRGSKFLTAILGIIIFIDDYFNALAVGQISRPLTDRYKVSRAKLAYLIDSTSAPICVISPVSSWGAVIIGIIGTNVIAEQNISGMTAIGAFMEIIPMNLYVFSALIMIFLVSYFNFNIGPMKKHEDLAMKTGQLYDPNKEVPGELSDELPTSTKGTIGNLVWPIVALFVGVIGAMLWLGASALEGEVTLLGIFENTDPSAALFYGGLFALIVSLVLLFSQISKGGVSNKVVGRGFLEGSKSMLPAIYILLFAWTIAGLIGELQTGEYIAEQVQNSNMNIAFLPVVIFIIAGFTALATGTSWGTFTLLLPIAGQIAAATDVSILLPALAAVLAGAVFGDHCSPISDTTILSSTGAGCNHIDHVMTQLPYALICAAVSIVGYIVLGLTGSTLLGLLVVVVAFVIIGFSFKSLKTAE
ncbi:Na+/H+ antiporter NhaC family protein [Sutcliffiella horikoshii]|uniref:Na+/H+ antiporter NhaC family protein n=1 Tax=Sutcliffiella horikoshii TaxID=79883 RepID=A0A1Y0CSF9_9BACI|nr:Na+/H+ antiporter NhaC family protein [Sutcliffiella horikoshii]ART77886.1 sodium:proton antiporter [Sutcliffiella horikoshii]TYS60173.1 Na+/H+ antiporter NhaC family protein [Sutcliffiella horikoshii]